MSDKIVIGIDIESNEAEKKYQNLINKLADKKIELQFNNKNIQEALSSINDIQKVMSQVNANLKDTPEYSKLVKSLEEAKGRYQELIKTDIILREEIHKTKIELSSGFKKGIDSAITSLKTASALTSAWGRRIFSLLKSAFVFNIISRSFRGISTLLGNLIKRDTKFASTLLIVKANLIRAFAPIFQVILPWIRALGRGLIWITNLIIKLINFLAGGELIKPIESVKEAQKTVQDFYKIASPKKSMFNLEKPAKQTKRIKDNVKKTKKEVKQTRELLASFDKLEVLKEDSLKALEALANDPSIDVNVNGLDDIKDMEVNLEPEIDEESVESQITNALSQMEMPPLDFTIDEDALTQDINGLQLPTLDFKINYDDEKMQNLSRALIIIRDVVIGIGVAIATYKIIKNISNLVSIGAAMVSPTGWISLAAGALALIVLHFEDIVKWCKEIANYWGPRLQDFFDNVKKKIGEWMEPLKKFIQFLVDGIGWAFGQLKEGLGFIAPNLSNLSPNFKGKIPGLAQGAVLNGGDPFLAFLNDQPRGQTNIETPLSTMVQAFKTAIYETGLDSGTTVNIRASGAMGELIRRLNLELDDEKERVGKSIIKLI